MDYWDSCTGSENQGLFGASAYTKQGDRILQDMRCITAPNWPKRYAYTVGLLQPIHLQLVTDALRRWCAHLILARAAQQGCDNQLDAD